MYFCCLLLSLCPTYPVLANAIFALVTNAWAAHHAWSSILIHKLTWNPSFAVRIFYLSHIPCPSLIGADEYLLSDQSNRSFIVVILVYLFSLLFSTESQVFFRGTTLRSLLLFAIHYCSWHRYELQAEAYIKLLSIISSYSLSEPIS